MSLCLKSKHLNELFIILPVLRRASNRLSSSWTILWGTRRAGPAVCSGRSHGSMEERAQGRGQSPVQGIRGQRELGKKRDRMNREMEKSILYAFISLVTMRFWVKKIRIWGIQSRFQLSFFWGKCCNCYDAVQKKLLPFPPWYPTGPFREHKHPGQDPPDLILDT